MSDPVTTPIVQFGTSRFLQAHADLFFQEGTPQRAVTIVQSSDDPGRRKRLAHLAEGYLVRIRGLSAGKTVDEERRVSSVRRTLSTAADWDEVGRVVTEEAEAILSNTGDRGYAPLPGDETGDDPQAMSYPAKLYHLLARRHAAGAEPLDIFPMELISDNGAVLRDRVIQIARARGAPDALIDWLGQCRWAVSLVDRIVSEPIEPAGAVAEPYALWAIEAQPGLSAPTAHDAIHMVDDLERIERLKLHILNLCHTTLAQLWMDAEGDADLTVGAAMDGPLGQEMQAIAEAEVLPGFAARGMRGEAAEYLATTLERFRNPFLAHRLSDIAQNHDQKIARRITAFLEWVRAESPDFEAPRLDRIAGRGDAA
jgi:tagaturonate reductase